jgi:hypothetical protein
MLLIVEIYFDLINNLIGIICNIIIIKGLDKLIKLLLKLGFWYKMNLITIK